MSAFIDNLRGWADDDCGRAGPVILEACDALEELEHARAMVSLTGDLDWPAETVPERLRRVLDAYWETQYAISDYIAKLGAKCEGETREETERRARPAGQVSP